MHIVRRSAAAECYFRGSRNINFRRAIKFYALIAIKLSTGKFVVRTLFEGEVNDQSEPD